MRSLPDNPLPSCLRRLEQRRNLGKPFGWGSVGLILLLLIGASWLTHNVRGPLQTLDWSSLLILGSLGFLLLLPIARGALGLLAAAEGSGRHGNSSLLQLDEVLASSPLSDTEVVVGVIRHYWPRLMLASAVVALSIAASQLQLVEQQYGVFKTVQYPHQLQLSTRDTLRQLVLQHRSPPDTALALLELASGGPDPARRVTLALPLTCCGFALAGSLAGLGWIALLIACGRGQRCSWLLPTATLGSVIMQLALYYSLVHEWQTQRLTAWSQPPAAPDWLWSTAALAFVGAVLSLQLLPGSWLWRAAMASGCPLLIVTSFAWLTGSSLGLSQQPDLPELSYAVQSGLSGLMLVLGSSAFVNPLAAPLPLLGGIAPGSAFTPPVWIWLSWPVMLTVQLLLTAQLLGQARLAVALRRGAQLD